MGIITGFLNARIDELKGIKEQGLVSFVKTQQPVRTAILLEVLDYTRPRIHSRYEHAILDATEPKKPKKRKRRKNKRKR